MVSWAQKMSDNFHHHHHNENILQGKSDEFVHQVKDIISTLKKAGLNISSAEMESTIILALKAMLEKNMDSKGNIPSLQDLSKEQQQQLAENIANLIDNLAAKGAKVRKEDIINFLVENIFKLYAQTKEQMHEEGVDDYEFLNEKDKKRIKEELIKQAIYELYKMLNPRRIAGETKLENFINNVVVRGVEIASKYEGGKPKDLENYDLSTSFLKLLQEKHHDFMKDKSAVERYTKNIGSNQQHGFER